MKPLQCLRIGLLTGWVACRGGRASIQDMSYRHIFHGIIVSHRVFTPNIGLISIFAERSRSVGPRERLVTAQARAQRAADAQRAVRCCRSAAALPLRSCVSAALPLHSAPVSLPLCRSTPAALPLRSSTSAALRGVDVLIVVPIVYLDLYSSKSKADSRCQLARLH